MYQYTDSQLPDLLEMECSDMELKNRTLSNFAELVRTGECKKFRGRLKVGVDLGTANTVLAVVDSTNRPIAGVSAPSHAIRDGVIVNYYESVQLVTKLKEELEEKLGTELLYAAAIYGYDKTLVFDRPGAGQNAPMLRTRMRKGRADYNKLRVALGHLDEEVGETKVVADCKARCCIKDYRRCSCRCGRRHNRHQHPQGWQGNLYG